MIATIGYEKADLGDFISTLHLAGVEILVDIRDRAQSRRKGFSKSALSEALASAGIDYIHLKELGDPKEGREAARAGDFKKFRQIFANVLKSEKATAALNTVAELASETSICLMCYERDEKTCHRKIVSDHLDKRLNSKTRHLGVKQGAGKRPVIRRVHDTHQSAAA
jgi:uncharacterized protein (DUF488 family)